MVRFLRLIPQYRETERQRDYETDRARKAEQRNIELLGSLDRMRQDLAAAQSLTQAARDDRDFWRGESKRWQEKFEQAVDSNTKDLRETNDFFALRTTGRTIHGVAPAVPQQQIPDKPLKPGGKMHPRAMIREAEQKMGRDLQKFFYEEQEKFQATQNTA